MNIKDYIRNLINKILIIIKTEGNIPEELENYLMKQRNICIYVSIFYLVSLFIIGFSIPIAGAVIIIEIIALIKYFADKYKFINKNYYTFTGKIKNYETKWYVNGLRDKYTKKDKILVIETNSKEIVKCPLGQYQQPTFLKGTIVSIYAANKHKKDTGEIIIDGYYSIKIQSE